MTVGAGGGSQMTRSPGQNGAIAKSFSCRVFLLRLPDGSSLFHFHRRSLLVSSRVSGCPVSQCRGTPAACAKGTPC